MILTVVSFPAPLMNLTTVLSFLFIIAAPIGDSLEIFPSNGLASVVPTIWYLFVWPKSTNSSVTYFVKVTFDKSSVSLIIS